MLENESTLDDYIEDEVDKETGTTKEEDAEILCAMNPNEIYSYVPKRYRGLPLEKQPIFKLKILSSREAAELENNSVNATTRGDKRQVMRVMGGTTTLKALEMGCRG